MKLDIKKLIREEVRLALTEDATSFAKKWLFAAAPSKYSGTPALKFKGALADELFKSYKLGKNTPVTKELYTILKPYSLDVQRLGKSDFVIYGDTQKMKAFLSFLEKSGATFVKSFKESIVSEAKVDPNVAKLSAKLRKAYDAGEDDLPRGSSKDCVKAKWPGFHGGEETYSQVLSLRPGSGPVQQALLFISDMTGKWKKTGRKGIFNVTPKGLVFLKDAN